jgi:hypothetical protein
MGVCSIRSPHEGFAVSTSLCHSTLDPNRVRNHLRHPDQVNTGPKNYVSLGLLPVKDPKMVRPTNVITRPNHDLWKLQGGSETKAWFQKAFPRLDLENMIDDSEWERFQKLWVRPFPSVSTARECKPRTPLETLV